MAGRQHNRLSREQLLARGVSVAAIERRLASGRLVAIHEGVYAVPPALESELSTWMGATLTAPGSSLNRYSAAALYGCWEYRRTFESVVRPGCGGPRRHQGLLVLRSQVLVGETTTEKGIPVTTVPRTLLDIAGVGTEKQLKLVLRNAIRHRRTTLTELGAYLRRMRGRRGAARLKAAMAGYSGLPIERSRSGSEIRAMELIRDQGLPMPRLNVEIAGEEADLSWPATRQIIEIDGGPFHLDAGEDARKARAWTDAGWTVHRISTESVHDRPFELLDLAAHCAERPSDPRKARG